MKNKKVPTLFELLKASTEDIRKYLRKNTDLCGQTWWYKAAKHGNQTVTLVCHIDTHWEKPPTTWRVWCNKAKKMVDKESAPTKTKPPKLYYDRREGILWSPDGLGADDRAGVFSSLAIYHSLDPKDTPNILFTDFEETGGKGAREAVEQIPDVLGLSLYFLELDRRRGKDVVFYRDEPEEFKRYIEKFGFKRTQGSFSDISTICKELEICGANVSVGFYDEHQRTEHLDIRKMMKTITKAKRMVPEAIEMGKTWHNPDAKKFGVVTYGEGYYGHEACHLHGYGDYDGYGGWGEHGFYGQNNSRRERVELYREEELIRRARMGARVFPLTSEERKKWPLLAIVEKEFETKAEERKKIDQDINNTVMRGC